MDNYELKFKMLLFRRIMQNIDFKCFKIVLPMQRFVSYLFINPSCISQFNYVVTPKFCSKFWLFFSTSELQLTVLKTASVV